MKRLETKMPNFRTNLICMSVCYIAIGAVLLIFPQVTLPSICLAMGVAAIIVGIINIAIYFLRKCYLEENQISFSIGAAILLFGVYAVIRPEDFAHIFTQLLALCMVFDSLLKLQFSMDLLRLKNRYWWILLLGAVATAGLAMAVLLFPFPDDAQKLTYTYIVLIVDGVVNIASMIFLNISRKKFQALQTAEEEE